MNLSARNQRNLTVDGITINIHTMADAVASIVAAAQHNESFHVCTLNLDHVRHLNANGDFRESYRRARFVTADGFPIVVLGRLARAPIQRTTGADLIEPVCEAAARNDLPIFLLGSDPPTLAECEKRLCARYEGLKVAGSFSPGRGFEANSAEADESIERVRASGAKLCFLARSARRSRRCSPPAASTACPASASCALGLRSISSPASRNAHPALRNATASSGSGG